MRPISIVTRMVKGRLADELLAAKPAARITILDSILREGLALLVRQGLPAPDGGHPPLGKAARLPVNADVFASVLRASEALRVPPGIVVREVLAAREAATDRDALELQYRRCGHPGDPRRLGIAVLRMWLDGSAAPTPELSAIKELTLHIDHLEKKVDELVKKYEARPRLVTAQEMHQMSLPMLKEYLRRLGGRAKRDATRGEVLAIIREKERL